jgi:hypothetical protein
MEIKPSDCLVVYSEKIKKKVVGKVLESVRWDD